MSFRTKIIIYINILILVFMTSLAAILVQLRSNEIRSAMEKGALTFAALTTSSLCEAYEDYYESGYFKFREYVLNLLELDRNLISVAIYTVECQKVFESGEYGGKGMGKIEANEAEAIEGRVRLIHSTFREAENGEYFDMVFPYLEPWGWHRYSVRYVFTKQYLKERLLLLRIVTFSVTFISVLLASFILNFITRIVTKPLEKLTDAAKEITDGNFDTEIEVDRRDEIGILAKTMKKMINRIKRDVELLESQKRTLSEANVELKRLNDLKSQFLASVSHELMTPLTSLKGYLEYIYQGKLGPLTPGQKSGLKVAKRNLGRLHNQMTNLLDFSSFESGKIELSTTPFHIKGVVKEVVANLDAKFIEKEIKFNENIPLNVPPIIADRERIVQVLENLLTNAVKFTPLGGTISVICNTLNDSKGKRIEVCVRDSGVGIPKGMKESIFERFFQVGPQSKHKGLGLGLSIVKSILDAHNEEITVESEKGKGSNFCFTLPVYGGNKK